MEKWSKIKVDKTIKPLHNTKREPFDLIVGNSYYVSFGSNNVFNCKLTEIEDVNEVKRISIEIPVKPRNKNGYIDVNGTISHNWITSHYLFGDEIGRTPEEAVNNEVTF